MISATQSPNILIQAPSQTPKHILKQHLTKNKKCIISNNILIILTFSYKQMPDIFLIICYSAQRTFDLIKKLFIIN